YARDASARGAVPLRIRDGAAERAADEDLRRLDEPCLRGRDDSAPDEDAGLAGRRDRRSRTLAPVSERGPEPLNGCERVVVPLEVVVPVVVVPVCVCVVDGSSTGTAFVP